MERFLKQSNTRGLFRLFQCLLKSNKIEEGSVRISYSDREDIESNEVVLIFNIDIKRTHLRSLKELLNLHNVNLPDLLVVYSRLEADRIQSKYFLLELGPHRDDELERKLEGFRENVVNRLNLSIGEISLLNVTRKGSHSKQGRRIRKIRDHRWLEEIINSP